MIRNWTPVPKGKTFQMEYNVIKIKAEAELYTIVKERITNMVIMKVDAIETYTIACQIIKGAVSLKSIGTTFSTKGSNKWTTFRQCNIAEAYG